MVEAVESEPAKLKQSQCDVRTVVNEDAYMAP